MAKAKTLKKAAAAGAAYNLVDLSGLDPELRDDIIEDASAGGGRYGIRVVEEAVNGGARAPIYGYYREGPDGERWAAAKKELGLDAEDIPDGDVVAGATGIEVQDARRAAALRAQAEARANAEAEAVREAEDADLEEIVGEDATPPVSRRAAMEPTVNTYDATLAPDATNEAADAENQEAESTSRSSRRTTNKAPK